MDRYGGTVKLIQEGWFQKHIADFAYETALRKQSGEKPVIGVNKYRMKPEDVPYRVPIYKFRPTAGQEKIAKLRKYKRERDNARVQAALDRLEKVCRSDENIFECLVLAYRSGATLQEGTDVCRKVYGLDTAQLMKL